jgi:hypothetical protein
MAMFYRKRVTDQVQLHPTNISRVSDDPRYKNLPSHVWYSAGKDGLANHAIPVGKHTDKSTTREDTHSRHRSDGPSDNGCKPSQLSSFWVRPYPFA